MSSTPLAHRHVFDVEAGFRVPDILGITDAVHKVGERDSAELVSTYYDTGDLGLLGTGLTVRRREGGAGTTWQIGRTDRDTEVAVAADSATIPARIHELTLGARQGQRLRRVGTLHIERNTCRALSGSGDLLATVSDDSVRSIEMPG